MLSPTKVDTFNGCQRLFYYRYVSPPFVPPEAKPLYLGNVVHSILQTFHERVLKGRLDLLYHRVQVNVMSTAFREAYEKYKMEERLHKGFITRQDLLEIKMMLKNYLRCYLPSLPSFPCVHQLEKLATFKIGPVPVRLKADRIDKIGNHSYRVVDYKTSKTVPSDKAHMDSVQIQSYGIMIRSLIDPEASVMGTYIYLKHLGGKTGLKSYRISDEMMADTVKKYEKIYDIINNGCKYFPNRKYKYCGPFCDFRLVCIRDAEKLINKEESHGFLQNR